MNDKTLEQNIERLEVKIKKARTKAEKQATALDATVERLAKMEDELEWLKRLAEKNQRRRNGN